eukprot:gene35312-43536_t
MKFDILQQSAPFSTQQAQMKFDVLQQSAPFSTQQAQMKFDVLQQSAPFSTQQAQMKFNDLQQSPFVAYKDKMQRSLRVRDEESARTAAALTLVTVPHLDLSSYMGRWFVMYGNQMPLDTYLKDGLCVVVDYTAVDPSKIAPDFTNGLTNSPDSASFRVTNRHRHMTPNSEEHRIQLIATNSHFSAKPGEFTLQGEGVVVDYYIVALGERVSTEQSTSQDGTTSLRLELPPGSDQHIIPTHGSEMGDLPSGHPISDRYTTDAPQAAPLPVDPSLLPDQRDEFGDYLPPSSPTDTTESSRHTDPIDTDSNSAANDDTTRRTSVQDIVNKVYNIHTTGESLLVYSWAVIATMAHGDVDTFQLFVMARNVTDFRARYEQTALQKVQELGLTQYSGHLVEMKQGGECKYAPMNSGY